MVWKVSERELSAYKCCFCCHVRTGTLILGLITLLGQGVVLSSFIVTLMHPDMLQSIQKSEFVFPTPSPMPDENSVESQTNPLLYYVTTVDQKSLVSGIAMTSILMTITSSLIYGTIRGNHCFLVPFLSFQILDACVTGLAMIAHITNAADLRYWVQSQNFFGCKEMLLKLDDDRLMLIALVMFISSMFIQLYFIFVVWACYNYLKERLRQQQCGRRYTQLDIYSGDTEILLPPKYEDIMSMPGHSVAAPPPAYSDN